jgi:uncharacterized membrane protein YphA (DoxX/SURF4 family)
MENSGVPGKLIMDKLFQNKYFEIAGRLFLGGLLIYASIDKMANAPDFLKVIHNYKVLPVQLENPLAIFLPWLEFLTGLFIVIRKWTKSAWLLYSTMLVVFIIALSQAQIRGLDISCGCFSVAPSSTSTVWLRIIEDIVMLFFSVNFYRFAVGGEEKELELSKN